MKESTISGLIYCILQLEHFFITSHYLNVVLRQTLSSKNRKKGIHARTTTGEFNTARKGMALQKFCRV